MFQSWRLGSAFGIGIYVHWTFALLPIWVLYNHWGQAIDSLIMMAFVVCLFGFVVLHELGHALAARHFGIGTQDITLSPIGGVARLERMSENPWEEFCIALAGPVVNAGLAVVFLVLTGVAFLIWNMSGGVLTSELFLKDSLTSFTPVKFLLGLVVANIMLGIFNLIPAFPMDGGRVLRSVLAMIMKRLTATEIAANIGGVFALLLALLGLLSFNPLLMFVAFFVFLAGRQELAMLRRQEQLKNLPTVQPVEQVDHLDPQAPTAVPERFSGILFDKRTRTWVIWQDGQPIDTVGRRSEE
jgi:Zn-dependent protease